MLPLSHALIQISFVGLLVFSFLKEVDGFPEGTRSEEKTTIKRCYCTIYIFILFTFFFSFLFRVRLVFLLGLGFDLVVYSAGQKYGWHILWSRSLLR